LIGTPENNSTPQPKVKTMKKLIIALGLLSITLPYLTVTEADARTCHAWRRTVFCY